MSDEAGFLKAIADKPGERVTRLAYADWLEENGRPQEAEFLKAQLQVAELSARLIELGGQLDAKWLTVVGAVTVNRLRITLRTGRDIKLLDLRQHSVYAGLLEGLPTREMNQGTVARLITDEQNRSGQTPYLVEPPEHLMSYRQGERYPFGTPARIPGIACIGWFDSSDPARDKSLDASGLTIIWFQDEYAFPIDPGVREQIRAIDWDQHAHDYDW